MSDLGSYMSSPVKTINSNSTLRGFINQLNENKISSLIVTENDKHVGIITKMDFIRKAISRGMNPETTKVAEIMSTPILSLDRSTSIEEAKDFMTKNHIRHVPVSEQNQIVGMISIKDTFEKDVDQNIINAFTKTAQEALQSFMVEASPLAPIDNDEMPGEISSLLKLTDEAKNVEIMIVLNFSEADSRKIYKNLFGEDASSIKDVCNIVAELVNILAGNVKTEISHRVEEILNLTHSENATNNDGGNFQFDVGLPATIVGSGHSLFGMEKLSTTKKFVPFVGEDKSPLFLLGLYFQKKEEI